MCGVIRRHGFPKFNQEYLQRIAFDDNFHMLTYLSALTMSSGSLIIYMPLILTAYMDISPKAKELVERTPGLPFNSYFRDIFTKGVQHKA